MLLLLAITNYEPTHYEDYPTPSAEDYVSPHDFEVQEMRVTCYVSKLNAKTYSGQVVHIGGCAGRKADLGKVAYIYTQDRELIGIFEINDIGSNSKLKNGTALDVWQPSMKDAKAWIREYGDYQLVKIVDAKG